MLPKNKKGWSKVLPKKKKRGRAMLSSAQWPRRKKKHDRAVISSAQRPKSNVLHVFSSFLEFSRFSRVVSVFSSFLGQLARPSEAERARAAPARSSFFEFSRFSRVFLVFSSFLGFLEFSRGFRVLSAGLDLSGRRAQQRT